MCKNIIYTINFCAVEAIIIADNTACDYEITPFCLHKRRAGYPWKDGGAALLHFLYPTH